MNGGRARCVLAAWAVFGTAALATESAVLTLERGSGGMCLVRNAAGGSSLLVADERGLEIRPWNGDSAIPSRRFDLTGERTIAYCVAGVGEAERIYVLDERRRVRTWDPITFETKTILEGAESMLPSGVFPMRFARDLDGDGDIDLAIPQATGFQLFLANVNGFAKGPRVDHRISIDVRISSWRDRDPAIRQSISIRDFEVKDQNGDGFPDLAFRDSQSAEYFWSGTDGALPSEPTFTVDLEQIKSTLPATQRGLIDTKNLLTFLDSKVNQLSRDLDGDGVNDLVMQKGKTVLVYRGAKDGVKLDKAVAALPTSGNLLAVAVYDEDGDGKLDLYMLHVGDISVAQVLLWLVASGELKVELFVYRQDPDKPLSFARKPSSRRTVTLSLPSAKTTVDLVEEETDKVRERMQRVPVVCDYDGDGESDDLAVLVEGKRIDVYPDALGDLDLTEALSWNEVAKRFDRDAKGKVELTIGLKEVVSWLPLLGLELHDRVSRASKSASIDLGATPIGERGASTLFALDLDRDGKDDFAALEADARSAPPRILFLIPR